MLKINLEENELQKLQVLCDYLFFDQFKDNASFPRFEQCFGVLFSNQTISLQQVFKEICGEKKKYITFSRFVKAYLIYKNAPGQKSLDFKNFFSHLMKTVLKGSGRMAGIETEKSKKYTSSNFKSKDCVSSLCVLTNKESVIKGMVIEYGDHFKTKLYDKKGDSELIKKLELKLALLDESKSKEKNFDELLYRDSITHVFGTFSNKLEFIGIKCRSGRIEFVGKPIGEAFLFGESEKQFHYMKIQVYKGITSIQPYFTESPRQNASVRKTLEEVDEDFLNEDQLINDEGHLATLTSQEEIDKYTANPIINDDYFCEPSQKDAIKGSDFAQVLQLEKRKWHGNDKEGDVGEVLTIGELLTGSDDDEEKHSKSKDKLYSKKDNKKDKKDDKKDKRDDKKDKDHRKDKDDDKKGKKDKDEDKRDKDRKKDKDEDKRDKDRKKDKDEDKRDKDRKKDKDEDKREKEDKKEKERELKRQKREKEREEKRLEKERREQEKRERKERKKGKKWDGVSVKSIKTEDILYNKENYKLLLNKVNANIKSELSNENNKAQLVKSHNFYDNYLKGHEDFKEKSKEIEKIKPLDNLNDLEKQYTKVRDLNAEKHQKKKQRVLRSRGPGVNGKVSSYFFESKGDNDDFFNDSEDDFFQGGYSYSYVEKSYSEDPVAVKKCTANWKAVSKKLLTKSGIKIIQTIGAVIRAIHFIQNCEDDFLDNTLSLQQKMDLYELLEKNQKIVDFLSEDTPTTQAEHHDRGDVVIEFDEEDLKDDSELTKEDLPDVEKKIKSIEAIFKEYPDYLNEFEKLYSHLNRQKNIIIRNEEKRVQEELVKVSHIDIGKVLAQEKDKRRKVMESESQIILQKGFGKRRRGHWIKETSGVIVDFSSQPTPDKIYKNQKYVKTNRPFVDEMFKPEKSSLCEVDRNGSWIRPPDVYEDEVEGWDKFLWCHPEEVFGSDDYQVFIDGIDHDDIIQGGLGDCYFLSAIAALCKFPKLVNKLFYIKEKTTDHSYGIYLCINGIWELILLDDLIPCCGQYSKNFAFSSSNGNEIWMLLLEKAWAKINGNYARVIGGQPHEVFDVITEAFSEKIDITARLSNQIWTNILQGEKNGFIMTAGTSGDTENLDIEEVGLVPGHAYTILRVMEVKCNGLTVRLVHIRNPWGSGEWSGDWSDSSKKWSPALKQELQIEKAKDDGEFYMSYEDFIKYYCVLGICKLHNDYHYAVMRTRAVGAEKAFITKVNVTDNQVHTYLQIYQKNPRIILKDGTYQQPVIAYMILVDKDFNYIASTTACSMNICVETTLNRGDYYLITDINYRYLNGNNINLHGYNITCYSSHPISLTQENSIQPNVLLDKALITYSKAKITPNKESMGATTYSSNKYSNDFPFIFAIFENTSSKDLSIKYTVECRGKKSFAFYCDPAIPETESTATKTIKPKDCGIFRIMKYAPSSMFSYSYESATPMDESSMLDIAFKEEGEALDDNGELMQYIHQDKNGYIIGIENNSRANLKLKLVLEGLYYVKDNSSQVIFDLAKKQRTAFQAKMKPQYKGDLSFGFEYA